MEGKLEASLSAYIKFGFGPFSVKKTFKFASITLLDFTFGCNADTQEPILASQSGSTLTLNIGPRAGNRLHTNTTDGDESFTIKPGTAPGNVIVEAYGFSKEYVGVTKIVADGGAGNDTVTIQKGVNVTADLAGGDGDDRLFAGEGAAILHGGAGNDQLVGRSGADQIFGEDGDDTILAGAGNDIIDGGIGDDTMKGEDGNDTVRGGWK